MSGLPRGWFKVGKWLGERLWERLGLGLDLRIGQTLGDWLGKLFEMRLCERSGDICRHVNPIKGGL